MHPSINDRVALLRKLATNVAAEHEFLTMLFRTRVAIVLLIIAGSTALSVATLLPDSRKVDHTSAPAAATVETPPAAPSAH